MSPFNETKYQELLKGLEITIFKKNEIISDNIEFRIDSEYYQKEYLELYKKLDNSTILADIVDMSDLSSNASFAKVASIIHDNNEKVIPFIRSGNVGDTFINENDLEFISSEAHYNLDKSITKLHDVMMARKGKIGGASIILENQVNFNCNENVIKLTIRDQKKINPFYFTVFFNSKYGKKQVERLATGNVQPWVSIFQIRKLKFKNASETFSKLIQSTIEKASSNINESRSIIEKTSSDLLSLFNLKNWQPNKESITIKKLSNSFLSTGRLDAEFYQPFYDEIEHILKSKGYALLENICSEINYGTVPTSPYTEDGTGIPYIKGTNFKNTLIESEGLDHITDTDELSERFYTKEGDIIISQMGTVGDTGVVEKHQEGWLFASFTIRVRIKDKKNFDPHFVAFYIQHIAKPYYLHRFIAQASVRQNTDLPTIKNLYVPKIPIDIQKEISKQIKQSFQLRQDSSKLIDIAKLAVEIAIEQDEKTAMKFIKDNT
jgi:hypothetical protein